MPEERDLTESKHQTGEVTEPSKGSDNAIPEPDHTTNNGRPKRIAAQKSEEKRRVWIKELSEKD